MARTPNTITWRDITRDEKPNRSDPLIFGPPYPGQFLFALDPDPDPTCNNEFIKLFSS